jgi:hypothetical protein
MSMIWIHGVYHAWRIALAREGRRVRGRTERTETETGTGGRLPFGFSEWPEMRRSPSIGIPKGSVVSLLLYLYHLCHFLLTLGST